MKYTENENRKLLTVIIPAYNMEWCIEKNLSTYILPDLEDKLSVIVIDNSSTDKTFDIARSFELRYPSIFKCIRKENNGYGSSVNLGISIVTSKFFKIIDADDFVNTGELRSFVSKLESCEADIVQTPYTQVDMKSGAKKEIKINRKVEETVRITPDFDQSPLPVHHTTTFNTEFIRRHPFKLLENTYYVDEELIIYPFFNAQTVCYFNDNIYCYMINNDNQSMSPINKIKYIEHRERIIKRLLNEYYNATIPPENIPYVKMRIALSVGNHFTTLYVLHPTKKVGRALADKYSDYLKSNYPEFYRAVKSKVRLLRIINLLGISPSTYERMKKFFRT